MEKPFSKREIIIASASVVLLVGLAAYAFQLHQSQATNDRLIKNEGALLQKKETDANTTANYIETICAEYRKLYASYRQTRYPDPTKVDKYIDLPGSAKGQIDKCYLPD
jgi:hypothetical protein